MALEASTPPPVSWLVTHRHHRHLAADQFQVFQPQAPGERVEVSRQPGDEVRILFGHTCHGWMTRYRRAAAPVARRALVGAEGLQGEAGRWKLAAGEAYKASGYVLVDEPGAPWKTDKLRRRFYTLVKSSGVRRVTLYDARHACLTYLAVSGMPDVVVSA